MYQGRLEVAVSILVCFILQAQGADKYTDENRPYEFGFNVEVEGQRQQHRHEKKDKDGIIMGEFGFVTADDVYHVTVYATDKEGRFKILSMKNIHLKSSPGAGTAAAVSARQGHSLALPASPASSAAPPAAPTPKPEVPFKPVSLEPPGRSCSSCSIPTTTRVPPPAPNNFAAQNQPGFPGSSNTQPSGFGGQSTGPQGLPNNIQQGGFGRQPQDLPNNAQQGEFGGQPQGLPNNAQQGGFGGQSQGLPNNAQQGGFSGEPQGLPNNAQQEGSPGQPYSPQNGSPNYSQQGPAGGQNFPQQPGQSQQSYPAIPSNGQAPNAPGNYGPGQAGPSPPLGQTQTPAGQPGQEYSNGPLPGHSSAPQSGSPGRTSKQYTGPAQQFDSNGPQGGQPGPVKPTLVTAQMQIVDKNTDIHALRPGEKHGLPEGLTQDDMTQLLYTFNYTVGFHGHFEEGYRNGAKKGYYFVTGRNGVRTRIDYTADDTGFHPKVSQEVLDLLSDDVPKPETEKDEKYGLKGYEFKWLYYPVESNSR